MRSLKEFAGRQDLSGHDRGGGPDDRNSLVGLECLQNADLLLVSTKADFA